MNKIIFSPYNNYRYRNILYTFIGILIGIHKRKGLIISGLTYKCYLYRAPSKFTPFGPFYAGEFFMLDTFNDLNFNKKVLPLFH